MLSSSATVTAPDGRTWLVRQHMEWWSPPSYADGWEHDMGSGVTGKAIGLLGICAFWVGFLVWFPGGQHVSLWIKVVAVALGLLVVAALPLRWFLLLPWTIIAESPGDQDRERELWTGLVRSRATAREETELIVRSIRATCTPRYESGVVHPIS